tara:strand:+ start:35259 stop:35771 length:513 start_codon:yes stop_codon:yes gene_type:complete
MQYFQLGYLMTKMFLFFIISSIVIGAHISLMSFAFSPNLILVSILLIYLSTNLNNTIFYIYVFAMIYGAISIEKVGWVLLICNIPIFFYMIIELLSFKKDNFMFLCLVTIFSETIFNLLFNINNLSANTLFNQLTYDQDILLLLGNYGGTIIMIFIINKIILQAGIQKYV